MDNARVCYKICFKKFFSQEIKHFISQEQFFVFCGIFWLADINTALFSSNLMGGLRWGKYLPSSSFLCPNFESCIAYLSMGFWGCGTDTTEAPFLLLYCLNSSAKTELESFHRTALPSSCPQLRS